MIDMLKRGAKVEDIETAGTIIIVGSPNVGKTTLFRKLCQKKIHVETPKNSFVELSYGELNLDGKHYKVIDIPGISSLFGNSEEELIVRDLIISEKNSTILQVIDGKNLKKDLILSCEIIELGKPMVFALNMMDEALLKGIVIDEKALRDELGVDVVMTIGNEGEGIHELKRSLIHPRVSGNHTQYSERIENGINEIQTLPHRNGFLNRAFVLQLLIEDSRILEYIKETFLSSKELERVNQIVDRVRNTNKNDLKFEIINRWVSRALEIEKSSTKILPVSKKPFWEKSSNYTYHPFYGILILLAVMSLLYLFVGKIGVVLSDNIQFTVFQNYLIPFSANLLSYIPSQFIYDAFLGTYGLISMGLAAGIAMVFPIICTFFALSVLEDSGYLSQVGILLNSLFKKIGLNGKAVLPLSLGFSCVTMATLSARALDTRKERIIVILLLWLGVPCSAQLSIFAAILASISLKAVLIIVGVIALQSLVVGYAAGKLIPGEQSTFFMEIRTLRLPNIKYTISRTVIRTKSFFREVIPLFFAASLILFLLDKLRVLDYIEMAGKPVVTGLLGLPARITEVFMLGFIRSGAGAALFKTIADTEHLSEVQIIVAMVVFTLYIPCFTSVLLGVKEYGLKIASGIGAFVVLYAFLIGIILNQLLHMVY